MNGDFSSKLDKILSNPAMMAQIKSLADTMTEAEEAPAPSPEAAPEPAGASSPPEQPASTPAALNAAAPAIRLRRLIWGLRLIEDMRRSFPKRADLLPDLKARGGRIPLADMLAMR